jgi:hypothetical protein
MKYAEFNADSTLKTCLIEGLHDIPSTAVAIKDALFLRITQETDGVWTLGADGEITKQPFPEAPPDYPAIIKAERYAREVAGVTVKGLAIATDRDTRATILDKAMGAMLDPAYVCNLKAPDGFVELTAPQILAIWRAISAYVQACFDREAALLAAVKVGTYADHMLATDWPSQTFDSAGAAQ